jgi:hypothetical protein
MRSTGYLTLQSLGKSYAPYDGGICRWWYTPRQNIQTFPTIDPLTQLLTGEPVLKALTSWYGPVNVPSAQFGYIESQEKSIGRPYYKRRVEGLIPGSDVNSHINLGNMPYHEYVVVAQLRAGGYFIVIGNDEVGMDFDHNFSTGIGSNATPGSKFSFIDECKWKPPVLANFAGLNSSPSPGAGSLPGSSGSDQNNTEIIPFTTTNIATTLAIAWNVGRKNNFGLMPLIQVWVDNGAGSFQLSPNALIACDDDPPNTSNFLIDLTGAATGFIVIK